MDPIKLLFRPVSSTIVNRDPVFLYLLYFTLSLTFYIMLTYFYVNSVQPIYRRSYIIVLLSQVKLLHFYRFLTYLLNFDLYFFKAHLKSSVNSSRLEHVQSIGGPRSERNNPLPPLSSLVILIWWLEFSDKLKRGRGETRRVRGGSVDGVRRFTHHCIP